MNIQFIAGKFFAWDNNGLPAVGYKVWAYESPDTSTPATTYSDQECTVANAWPVVLDARGEAFIYVNAATDFYFTTPTATDISSPIWTSRKIGEQQAVDLRGDGVRDANNNYVVTISPVPTALTNRMTLIMTPDHDSLATLVIPGGATVPTVFTGSGINDGTFSGPYVGSTSGSVFTVQIDATVQLAPVVATLAENVTAGLVTVGNHSVKLTAVTAGGETTPGAASNIVNAAGSKQLDVSGIPAIAGEITGYNVYLNKAGGTTWYLVNTTPITTTTYTINIADATLGTGAHVAAPTSNTTAGGGLADTFKWKKDGGAWTSGVVITAAKQTLIEGISIIFAELTGHTLNDIWAVTVKTPVRVNLNSLGNKIVYKNVGGSLEALAAGDLKQDIAGTLVYNLAADCWILNNPSTAAASGTGTSITTDRPRIEVNADYTVLLANAGCELSCSGTLTLDLHTTVNPPNFVNKFIDLKNVGTGIVTIDTGTYTIKGIGGTTYQLFPGEGGRIITNGVDWHILWLSPPMRLIYRATVTNETSVTITGLRPGYQYRLNVRLLQNSSNGQHKITFNADTGSNYSYSLIENITAYVGSGNAFIPISVSTDSNLVVAANEVDFTFEFSAWESNAHKTNLFGSGIYYNELSQITHMNVSGFYSGAANLSSITYATGSGTVTGAIELYEWA
jgi:hypothetical protein